METIKLQIEIRFTPILDFSLKYKSILSPYLKLTNFSIQNFGAAEESCVLIFKDEPHIRIDARWDRLIYVVHSTDKNAFEVKSPIIYFFEIYDKLSKSESFGQLNDFLVASWHLKPSADDNKNAAISYANTWIKKEPTITDFSLNDVAIVYETKKGESEIFKLQFGPFKAADIKTFGLSQDANTNTWEDKKGLLIHSVYVMKKVAVTVQTVKNMYLKIVTTINTNF